MNFKVVKYLPTVFIVLCMARFAESEYVCVYVCVHVCVSVRQEKTCPHIVGLDTAVV